MEIWRAEQRAKACSGGGMGGWKAEKGAEASPRCECECGEVECGGVEG
jgi:hypothetical protein